MTCKEQILALVCVFHIWIFVWYNHVQYAEGILKKKFHKQIYSLYYYYYYLEEDYFKGKVSWDFRGLRIEFLKDVAKVTTCPLNIFYQRWAHATTVAAM